MFLGIGAKYSFAIFNDESERYVPVFCIPDGTDVYIHQLRREEDECLLALVIVTVFSARQSMLWLTEVKKPPEFVSFPLLSKKYRDSADEKVNAPVTASARYSVKIKRGHFFFEIRAIEYFIINKLLAQ